MQEDFKYNASAHVAVLLQLMEDLNLYVQCQLHEQLLINYIHACPGCHTVSKETRPS
jgi:hypothetical protein